MIRGYVFALLLATSASSVCFANPLSFCKGLFRKSLSVEAEVLEFSNWSEAYRKAQTANNTLAGAEALTHLLRLKSQQLGFTDKNQKALDLYARILYVKRAKFPVTQVSKNLVQDYLWSLGPFLFRPFYHELNFNTPEFNNKLQTTLHNPGKLRSTLGINADPFFRQVRDAHFGRHFSTRMGNSTLRKLLIPLAFTWLSLYPHAESSQATQTDLFKALQYVDPITHLTLTKFPLYNSVDYLNDLQKHAQLDLSEKDVRVIYDQPSFLSGEDPFSQNWWDYGFDPASSRFIAELDKRSQSLRVYRARTPAEVQMLLEASADGDVVILISSRLSDQIVPFADYEKLSTQGYMAPQPILKKDATLILSGQAFANRVVGQSNTHSEDWVVFGRRLLGNSGRIIAPTNFVTDEAFNDENRANTLKTMGVDFFLRASMGPYIPLRELIRGHDLEYGHSTPGFRVMNLETNQEEHYRHDFSR